MKMDTALQVGLLGKFQSCPSTKSLQYIRTFSNRKPCSKESASRNLFGAPEPGEITKLYYNLNEENKKYLEDTYCYPTSKDEKSSSTSSNCHHPNLLELERKEYESKMKNSKITSHFRQAKSAVDRSSSLHNKIVILDSKKKTTSSSKTQQ
ncbi:hypothetical protein ACFFRR_005979 [Megaselia abdita]